MELKTSFQGQRSRVSTAEIRLRAKVHREWPAMSNNGGSSAEDHSQLMQYEEEYGRNMEMPTAMVKKRTQKKNRTKHDG